MSRAAFHLAVRYVLRHRLQSALLGDNFEADVAREVGPSVK